MLHTIGALAFDHLAAGRVEDGRLVGTLTTYPEPDAAPDTLRGMPAADIVARLAALVTHHRHS